MLQQASPIVYITQVFPALTETFVYREVLALRERGIPVRTFAVWRPDPGDLSAETMRLMDETFHIFPLSWPSLILVHLSYLFGRPRRYLGALIFVVTQPGESLRNRGRSLLHFFYGMLAVSEMERLKTRHIHAHFAWSASSIALIASRLLGISFSLTLHSNEIYFDRLLLEAKVRHARFVVTISDYNRQLLLKLISEDGLEDRIHVVHCGLDPDVFTPSPKPQEKDDKLMIVGVAQLAPRKGFRVLIHACHHLNELGIPFRCHILGEGEERSRLERLVDQYNLQEQVLLPGRIYQEDLRQLLSQADVFVLPCVRDESGDQDGIPVSLMEAMAMELPTVSTTISGIPELIDHGRNGWLVPPGDALSLANALRHLKEDPDLWQRLGKAARETVVNEFNIYRSAEQMAALFEEIT